MATQVLSAECNKPQNGIDETPAEPVKPKVKKKRVVNNSKSEGTSVENVKNITGEAGVPETSLKANDTVSHLDGSSSQKTEVEILKTAIRDKTNENSDVSDKVLKKKNHCLLLKTLVTVKRVTCQRRLVLEQRRVVLIKPSLN